MSKDHSTFISKKHDLYHEMLQEGFDGILSKVNLSEDQMLKNVKCHINLMHKNRKKPGSFEIDSVEKLIKLENYKSYFFLLERNLLTIKSFPIYQKKISIGETVYSYSFENFFSQKKNLFLNNGNIYELFIEGKKSDLLPKIINFYLRNKKNTLYLIDFINHYFQDYEGNPQKIKEIMDCFNNDSYQNINNKSFVMAYLKKTLQKEKNTQIEMSTMYYHNQPISLLSDKSKLNEIKIDLYDQEGKIKYFLLSYKKRLKYIHKYIEDSNLEIVDCIKGFEDSFEFLPGIKRDLYLNKYNDIKVLYEKMCIDNILNKSKEEHMLKIRL